MQFDLGKISTGNEVVIGGSDDRRAANAVSKVRSGQGFTIGSNKASIPSTTG
jgi:hypothetical protein